MTFRLLGSAVRADLNIPWPLIPSVDDGTQKKTTRPWKALQNVSCARPYDSLSAEMWSIPTGRGIGVIVLDFDGTEGEATRLAWGLTEPHVRTGSGSHHVYVAHPGWSVRTYAGGAPGVDIRGDGGVAHVAGASRKGPYVVLRDLTDPLPFTALPEAARSVILRRKVGRPDSRPTGWMPGPGYRAAAIAFKVAEIAEAPAGTRNQAVNKAAFYLGCQRVPLHEVMPALLEAALAAGLGEGEADATIRSGWTAGA